ncbi:MAG TPA: transcription elongation factor GreA [Fimbriimonas sp.]|nr:transcription elongation factor GreA [Fimbriimonas sp.]
MSEPELISDAQGGLLLTPAGFKQLQSELDHLTAVKRPEIADRIRESQQHGEFSEDNNELDEVKFEQAMVENRIAELKTIFGNAHVLDEEHIPVDHVGIGSLVTVRDAQFDDEFEIRVVMSVEADPANDLISNESPMGMALIGHRPQEEVVFDAPEGKKRYKVVKISK